MKRILIITTINDLSIPLFLTKEIKDKISVDFSFYHEDIAADKDYDYIYLRDPFTDDNFDLENIKQKAETVLKNNPNSYIIDSIKDLEDILFEDKWIQYQAFSKFMPQTKLLKNLEEVDDPQFITKKRISSRSKGIIFRQQDLEGELSSYIFQKKLNIKKEYRIYVVFNKIINPAALKTSKTISTKTKIQNSEELSEELTSFVEDISKNIKFDFIGLDIAETDDGLWLLEINRSCLFNGYFNITGTNLAERFINNLLTK